MCNILQTFLQSVKSPKTAIPFCLIKYKINGNVGTLIMENGTLFLFIGQELQ